MKIQMLIGRRAKLPLVLVCLFTLPILFPTLVVASQKWQAKPNDEFFDPYQPLKAPPQPHKLLLKRGDNVAIVGDSITEQRRYSQLMEMYLTVCVPDLRITTRQFGWSGETAQGFLRRMTNDCLSFAPTVVTTSFGMNDYKYRPFDEANGEWYRSNYTAVVAAFKHTKARVILGSPTCVGKVASWVKSASGTVTEHNQHLCKLRNIDIEIAKDQDVRFADQFWPMLVAGFDARLKYGSNYEISGKDGVHPGWAGHVMMAYAYLKAMGLDGNLGTITVNLKRHTAKADRGHVIQNFFDGQYTIVSRRYPFCATGEINSDNSVRSGMTLVPFNKDLNRFLLIVKGGTADRYRVTWGGHVRIYSREILEEGINLAADFPDNPFSEEFAKVDKAVAEKQAFETHQIKESFHSAEARKDLKAVMEKTEVEHARLSAAVCSAFQPVTHTIKIEPE